MACYMICGKFIWSHSKICQTRFSSYQPRPLDMENIWFNIQNHFLEVLVVVYYEYKSRFFWAIFRVGLFVMMQSGAIPICLYAHWWQLGWDQIYQRHSVAPILPITAQHLRLPITAQNLIARRPASSPCCYQQPLNLITTQIELNQNHQRYSF